MKKRICITRLILCLMLIFTVSISSFALENFGTFSYWNSAGYRIGYIPTTNLTYRVYTSSGSYLSTADLLTYTTYAEDQWSSVVNLTRITSGTAAISTYGITRAQANNMSIPAQAAGQTNISCTQIGTATYNSQTKNVYTINSATIYLVDYDWAYYDWENIITHEWGHAIGFFDHCATTTDLMYKNMNSIISPSSSDEYHMGNVY